MRDGALAARDRPGTLLPERRVRARNLFRDAANRIHDDVVARRHGYEGALVAGVTVYGYLSRLAVDGVGDGLGRRAGPPASGSAGRSTTGTSSRSAVGSSPDRRTRWPARRWPRSRREARAGTSPRPWSRAWPGAAPIIAPEPRRVSGGAAAESAPRPATAEALDGPRSPRARRSLDLDASAARQGRGGSGRPLARLSGARTASPTRASCFARRTERWWRTSRSARGSTCPAT